MKKFFIGLVLLTVPTLTSAHGLVTTLTQDYGDYTIEFEYNKLSNIVAGDYIVFDTYLLDPNGNSVPFDGAFIKLTEANGEVALAANLSQAADIPGSARVSTTVEDPGPYSAEVQITKGGKIIGDTNYNFTVESKSEIFWQNAKRYYEYIPALLGMVGLIAAAFIQLRKRKKNK